MFIELYATSEPTPVTTESTDSNIANVNKQCIKSDTKMFDNVGSVIDSSCKNDKIFEENFNDLKEAKWSIKEYFPNGPVSIRFAIIQIFSEMMIKMKKSFFIIYRTMNLMST